MKGVINMVKLGLVLGVFATAACVMLAFVYTGTKPAIDMNKKADTTKALQELFPGATFPDLDLSDEELAKLAQSVTSPDTSVNIENVYRAEQNGRLAGAALRVSRGGYSGKITMIVGVSTDGIITGVKILDHTETPGLGANAKSPKYFVDRARGITFYGQFTGKSINDPFEVKGDVDVITASTITSRAVALSVKAAGVAVIAWFDGLEVDVISSATEGGAE